MSFMETHQHDSTTMRGVKKTARFGFYAFGIYIAVAVTLLVFAVAVSIVAALAA